MPLLQAFLIQPSTRRILRKRSGDQGFSLIELVVVVAVLAVLAAIALPNFLNVNKDAQISSAKNTLATIVKECAVKEARIGSATIGKTGGTGKDQPIQSIGSNLNGYAITSHDKPPATAATARDQNGVLNEIKLGTTDANVTCHTASAVSKDGTLPNFTIVFDAANGTTNKECHGGATATYLNGCNADTNNTVANNKSEGKW
jgi:prepilin-type N-terminal cleavage/methylation domain-containing protein